MALANVVVHRQYAVRSQRYLRAYTTTEERGGLDIILNFFKRKKVDLKAFLNEKNDGVDVLKSLQLGDDVASALNHAKLEKLNKYIRMFNNKHADGPISLVGILSAHYGDDAVAKTLVYLERHSTSPDMVSLASKLRVDQLNGWLTGGQSVDDVFTRLNLKSNGVEALENRKFMVLEEYIAK